VGSIEGPFDAGVILVILVMQRGQVKKLRLHLRQKKPAIRTRGHRKFASRDVERALNRSGETPKAHFVLSHFNVDDFVLWMRMNEEDKGFFSLWPFFSRPRFLLARRALPLHSRAESRRGVRR